ncbi:MULTISPECIES: hypothetical protein [unclassified Massilia]|uniref:hypothetical protein n=1 Tax=unclassified Massilia TaxID=2609279 RepID=UPI00177F0D23|nr:MULTISPECIES: hypothetical protein [unclassified Massilia]MBD8531825.1 hypothetical protein [Massilia sp. CFBP 13647]MBD8675270.1 hypothetical protein [Massilia sp. CFBP 13721]
MMRRSIAHVLLSLLLLVSQQMAFAHAMSHWTGKIAPAHALAASTSASIGFDAERDLSSSVAQDGSCSQCLAFAQMASAIGSTPRQFVPLDFQAERAGAFAAIAAPPRTVCAFHSRAPPSFV